MNYEWLLIFLAFPLAWPFVAKRIWHHTINWKEMGLQILIPVVLVTVVFFAGRYGALADTEIWNGVVTAKKVNDGSYVRTYPCRCRTTSCGKNCSTTTCDTCFENRYTRSYDGYSTVGDWTFDSIDTTSRSRRNSFGPPASYTNCRVGEPASREHSYTNYIKAVPDSLFNNQGTTMETFQAQNLIPQYPRVYGHYRINRVLAAGVSVPTAGTINTRLNEHLIRLGAEREANIIVVIAKTADQTYRYALEEAWLGGKKNDVIVIMGVTDYPKIEWVDTITLGHNAGNSLMTVTMRDDLMSIGSLEDGVQIADTIASVVRDKFDRKPMEDFEYLKDEIDPPLWVVILVLILGVGGSLGLTVLFHRNDFFENGYSRYRRFR